MHEKLLEKINSVSFNAALDEVAPFVALDKWADTNVKNEQVYELFHQKFEVLSKTLVFSNNSGVFILVYRLSLFEQGHGPVSDMQV